MQGHRPLSATGGRLLGADDLARLRGVLRRLENENPVCVTAGRLVLLTGPGPRGRDTTPALLRGQARPLDPD